MAVAKMKLVNIVGRLKDFDEVVQNCCVKGNFHPEQSSQALEGIEEFKPIEEMNPYSRTLQKIIDIGVHSGIKLGYHPFEKLGMTDGELEEYAVNTEQRIDALNFRVRELHDTVARLEQGLETLSHLTNMDISLDDLFNSKFVKFRFGKLPKESYQKLDTYNDTHEDIFFFPLEEDDTYYWGFYVAPVNEIENVDEDFTSFYFERVEIVEEAHGTPSEAISKIKQELAIKAREQEEAKKAIEAFWKENEEQFLVIYSRVRYLSDCFDIHRYASKYGDNFYIFGWVPESEIANFEGQFSVLPDVDCIVEETEDAENIQPPTSLVNNPVSRPFENYIEMYGLPSYNEIDPTPFMSLSYSLIFGIMFGDVGHGFLVLLVALFMKYKKKMFLGDIMIRCSIFSIIFGALYNSIFGYDGLLPFTVLPVHETSNVMTDLLVTVALGVFIIFFCMGLNIVNGIRQRNIEKIFFSQNGLAGAVLYASLLCMIVVMFMFNKSIMTPVFLIICILLPVILIGLKEPLSKLLERKKDWMPEKKGEFFITAFFELFEIALSFLSNTVSYIRIGAFILSHAAMMTAVFAIGSMFGNSNNPIVLIIGNIFVVGLEGLIVGIQGLRLQFYEMFSRFYDGGGKPFEPARIKYDS